jgi:hypothetical protein
MKGTVTKLDNQTATSPTMPARTKVVRSLGDLMCRLDELDEETYDEHVDIKRTQQRIANNRQRLEGFKLAFKAGSLRLVDNELKLPSPTPIPAA